MYYLHESLVDADMAAEMLKISRSTFYRVKAQGFMPKPVAESPRFCLWLRSDIEQCIPLSRVEHETEFKNICYVCGHGPLIKNLKKRTRD